MKKTVLLQSKPDTQELWAEVADEYKYDLSKGDFIIFAHGTENLKVLSSCPNCGEASFSGNHKINVSDNGEVSLSPSVVFSCCGWHGHLQKNSWVQSK